ncbi:MAG: efflux RND transporter periplasmic adaptor subunit [Rhizobiales bacterium]|nr:efflux RND transporter periplasmic adaptor subunit [Hyphomicrobiales bacterium]
MSTIAERSPVDRATIVGTVEPRYKTELGFRVLGRLIARPVHVGDTVEKGQVVAAIDPATLELSVRSAVAELSNSQAQLANATGVEGRQRTLLETDTTTRANLDTAEQARSAAQASVARAQANLTKAREQLGYAQVSPEFGGVVTAVGAEVGQVVSPGQSVVTVARPDVREAVIDVSDEVANGLRIGTSFIVSQQLDSTITATGKVREIAPRADRATRTRRVRITLDNPPPTFRLGTTVATRQAGEQSTELRLPASAVLVRDGKAFAWIVDPSSRTVTLRALEGRRADDGSMRVTAGIEPGMRVVTAGVHTLKEGQKVRVDQEAQP